MYSLITMNDPIQTIVENLINGNLKDAKQGARRVKDSAIAAWTIENLGYDNQKARATALYLKGKITFPTYCNVMAD